MPSWNVHTAHVQRLLREASPSALGIRDVNAFLFGNFVPDINIGYMVKNPSGILPYRLTHFSKAAHIPVPNERAFWDTYVEPRLPVPDEVPISPAPITVERSVELIHAGVAFEVPATPEAHADVVARLKDPEYRASDEVLGAWCHLLCDNAYNSATRAWLTRYGVPAGEQTRIRKQGDFDKFGRTLPIDMTTEATPELIAQAAAFPQYAVNEADARAAVAAANAIVASNQAHHIEGTPAYSLFTADFFHEVFEHATEILLDRITSYASRHRD